MLDQRGKGWQHAQSQIAVKAFVQTCSVIQYIVMIHLNEQVKLIEL